MLKRMPNANAFHAGRRAQLPSDMTHTRTSHEGTVDAWSRLPLWRVHLPSIDGKTVSATSLLLVFALVDWFLMTMLVGFLPPLVFWVAAVIARLCVRSSQLAGPVMLRRLLTPDRKVEFFRLWSFASHLAVGGKVR